jgi:thiol-disulfide isomerase/thioredoxin
MKKHKNGPEFKAGLKDGETIALFYASWCPDCMRFCPKYEKKFGSKPNCVMVAIDEDEDPVWGEYKIKAVPTVLVFKGKKIVKRFDWVNGTGLDIEKIK